ncbi:MAG: Gfo/Idh/MocA family oxidoreductase [Candidatus Latescibacteria bacterium]|jgi:predicted dehydrogenase|nr:Gfo/Idh/MocA family oxidoreductase [Candidatus Latescibacterota bacterium]
MKNHNVLVVGVGSIGERHVRCFQSTGRAIVSICEPLEARRLEVTDRYGIDRPYSSLDEALASPCDVAVVAVPANRHVPVALQLAEAGCHLLIEKPLSTSLDGVDQLRRLVNAQGIVAAVGYQHRLNPALADMKEALAIGRFGKPVQIVVTCGQHFPTYRPAYRDVYFADRAAGGGAIQDAITHMLNAGEWLVGPIQSLVADAAHQVLDGVSVEDTVHILTRQDGAMGNYTLNLHQAPNENTVTVICSEGTVRWEIHNHRWRWMTAPGNDWTEVQFEPCEREAFYVRQAEVFLNAVEGGGKVHCSLDEGIQTLKVNLAALASVEQGSGFIPVEQPTTTA